MTTIIKRNKHPSPSKVEDAFSYLNTEGTRSFTPNTFLSKLYHRELEKSSSLLFFHEILNIMLITLLIYIDRNNKLMLSLKRIRKIVNNNVHTIKAGNKLLVNREQLETLLRNPEIKTI